MMAEARARLDGLTSSVLEDIKKCLPGNRAVILTNPIVLIESRDGVNNYSLYKVRRDSCFAKYNWDDTEYKYNFEQMGISNLILILGQLEDGNWIAEEE